LASLVGRRQENEPMKNRTCHVALTMILLAQTAHLEPRPIDLRTLQLYQLRRKRKLWQRGRDRERREV
jgi:hypothetical protein